jgi:hypothetical protein
MLLLVALWGVLKIILVRADLTDVLPCGRLAAPKNSAGNRPEDTPRFPRGVLTMAEGAAGHCSKPEPSPARLRSDSFKS